MKPCGPCETCCYWLPNQESVEQAEDGKYLCTNPEVGIRTSILFGCSEHMGANATEVNVPDHLKAGTMFDANPNKLDGPTEVLIRSHHKDFEWLVYALRSIAKYFTGFQGTTIVFPNKEVERFKPLRDQFDVRLHGFDQVEGKGHLHGMVMMASADEFLPSGTKYVLTTDSDGIFKMPCAPEHFAWNDKPYWIARSWESLVSDDPHNPGAKIISDNMQWRGVTSEQLGFDPELFTMAVNCQLIPLDVLPSYRTHVGNVHRKPFIDYMVEGRNEFPPTRTDFNALGAFFHKFHRERFFWYDVMNPPFPGDRKKSYWSWGGFTPQIREEIEGFLA